MRMHSYVSRDSFTTNRYQRLFYRYNTTRLENNWYTRQISSDFIRHQHTSHPRCGMSWRVMMWYNPWRRMYRVITAYSIWRQGHSSPSLSLAAFYQVHFDMQHDAFTTSTYKEQRSSIKRKAPISTFPGRLLGCGPSWLLFTPLGKMS